MTMPSSVVLREIESDLLSSCDLAREAQSVPGGQAYIVRVLDEAERQLSGCAELLWYPSAGRGGIAWGADATWTDAADPEDAAVRVLLTGEIIQ